MKIYGPSIFGESIPAPQMVNSVADLLARYADKRPAPDRNLDHFRATESTLAKRAELLAGITEARTRVLFLGDNDLTSIALAVAKPELSMTVVDIDRRILDFIESVASSEGFSIDLLEHDLRTPLQKNAMEEQDLVFCDPPYTPRAIHTWLQRSIELTLKSGRRKSRKSPDRLMDKRYLLCYGYTDRATDRGLAVQQVMTDLRLVLMEKFRAFNDYHGAKAIGGKSDLYLLQPTPQVDLRWGEMARGQFYTGKKKK